MSPRKLRADRGIFVTDQKAPDGILLNIWSLFRTEMAEFS